MNRSMMKSQVVQRECIDIVNNNETHQLQFDKTCSNSLKRQKQWFVNMHTNSITGIVCKHASNLVHLCHPTTHQHTKERPLCAHNTTKMCSCVCVCVCQCWHTHTQCHTHTNKQRNTHRLSVTRRTHSAVHARTSYRVSDNDIVTFEALMHARMQVS